VERQGERVLGWVATRDFELWKKKFSQTFVKKTSKKKIPRFTQRMEGRDGGVSGSEIGECGG
jgi:hypothetical protein